MIVDEEQRFGVAQKELLRSLRLEVDVLSLTATPIPRTLHMSLSGLRDISMIETPPEGPAADPHARRASTTRSSCKTALEREADARRPVVLPAQPGRDDREAADRIRQLVPSSASRSATGRCASASSRRRCSRSCAGDADVLVSTTIIESGLDIPQANTLIVERADALGLAQLYQIRGRVGRSDLLAHAYLFYPDASELTPEARARLATLADHTELGAGLRDRDARPRDPRRGRAARRRAARAPRRARLRALRRAARRGRGRAGRRAAHRRTPGARRRADRRLRARGIHPGRGAEDRPPPTARADGVRGRAPRARGRDRRPLRPAARARREPVRDPGGEAEARAARRRLPRVPRRAIDRRPPRPGLRGASRTP